MICAEYEDLKIEFDETGGCAAVTDLISGARFSQSKTSAKILSAAAEKDRIVFQAEADGVRLDCVYRIKRDETGRYMQLCFHSTDEFDKTVNYPPAFSVRNGDREYDACCEGIAFYVEEDIPLLNPRPLYGGKYNSMSFWGLSSGEHWVLAAVITNADAMLNTEKDENGLYQTSVLWEPEKGKWGYTRELRFYLGSGNAVNGICGTYRKVAEQKGLVKTLADRAKQLPCIDRLAGSANVWLWNDDAMDKLYASDAVYTEPSQEQLAKRRRIAEDMKKNGMTDVLWSIFDETIDKATVAYVKSLGFLTTYYDVYTDVIPKDYADKIPETRLRRCAHRMEYWPEGIVTDKEGNLCPAWALKGKDGEMYPQHRMCDAVMADCAGKYVKSHGVGNGIEGVFIDVSLCGTRECYHEKHPQTRREAVKHKNELFKKLKSMGVFSGSENGHEDVVRNYEYNEGMMSVTAWRMRDSGRRMTDLYSLDEAEEKIVKYMLNPKYRVPLWEMVYHDCQTSYWYWGDSSNSVLPLIKTRDLFDILYGLPPIYSVKAGDWEMLKGDILNSYHRTVPSARSLRYAKMISFAYLTDDMMVQKTVFDNGCEIIVNFGDGSFAYGNQMVGAGDFLITG